MKTPPIISQKRLGFAAKDSDRLQQWVESPRYQTTHGTLLINLKEELNHGKILAGRDRHSHAVTAVEVFLDFDPVFPGWPPEKISGQSAQKQQKAQ